MKRERVFFFLFFFHFLTFKNLFVFNFLLLIFYFFVFKGEMVLEPRQSSEGEVFRQSLPLMKRILMEWSEDKVKRSVKRMYLKSMENTTSLKTTPTTTGNQITTSTTTCTTRAQAGGKYSKRRRSNVAIIIVEIVFIGSFLFYCLLFNHSFQNKPKQNYSLL